MTVPPPIAMLAELTHRCPLSCPYCSNPVELARAETELATEDWVRVFREAADLGVLQLHLSGGEPASRRDLTDLVRAAREAGLSVPKEVIDRAVAYVRRCQNTDGGFRYRINDAAESRPPRSAAALVALYSSGVTEGLAVDESLVYLSQQTPSPRTPRDPQYYFYGVYYATLAMWHAGDDHWQTWYPAQRDDLLRLHQPTGPWHDPWVGNDYATAMALIALQLPYDRVPIFER